MRQDIPFVIVSRPKVAGTGKAARGLLAAKLVGGDDRQRVRLDLCTDMTYCTRKRDVGIYRNGHRFSCSKAELETRREKVVWKSFDDGNADVGGADLFRPPLEISEGEEFGWDWNLARINMIKEGNAVGGAAAGAPIAGVTITSTSWFAGVPPVKAIKLVDHAMAIGSTSWIAPVWGVNLYLLGKVGVKTHEGLIVFQEEGKPDNQGCFLRENDVLAYESAEESIVLEDGTVLSIGTEHFTVKS